MSYIDTFDNEFVGYFGGIPVYHPLEVVDVTPNDPCDFACGPENLVIGGGSGEHPGIVVKQPDEAVACFVRAWLIFHEQQYPAEHLALQPVIEAWTGVSKVRRRRWWGDVFEFAGWQAERYVNFTERCSSPAFVRPYRPSEDESLELWLAESVGEFILLAMPELAPTAIERLGDLGLQIAKTNTPPLFANILLLPLRYLGWGRREVDHRVQWGTSAWRIERTRHPLTIRADGYFKATKRLKGTQ